MKYGFCIIAALAISTYAKAADATVDNAEMKQIYEADQKDRDGFSAQTIDFGKLQPRDRARRLRVRELIDQGGLNTGKDYSRAALVFQHGEDADDILMAHILAMTALGKGAADARWLAATTLDRLLQRLGQAHVFGTQFNYKIENGQPAWTMDPYNRTLIPENLRKMNCVPGLKSQAEMLEAFSHNRAPTLEAPCAVPPQ